MHSKFESAISLFQSGQLNKANNICSEILKDEPNNFEILHLLGIIFFQEKKYDLSVEYIKKAAKIDKGSPIPHINKVGKIKKSDLLQIAKEKMEELNAHDLESASKMIEGTARSMGIEVIEG